VVFDVIKFIFLSLISLNLFAQADNFEYLQKYLEAAPVGIDARYAWTIPGGTGKNVKIIDIETGIASYNDLSTPYFMRRTSFSDHGASVMGVLVSKNDNIGTTGIVYDANWGFISKFFFGVDATRADTTEFKTRAYATSLAKSIEEAGSKLEAGDVLLIEIQVTGATNKSAPAEYWPEVYAQLKKITSKGIHCVAAAGNGGHSLDHKSYLGAFNLKRKDSGCILVAAVTLEPTNDSRGHRKVQSSNFGSRIDAHGYGKNVATVGTGDLLDDGNNTKYTRFFSGTSSATPIVAGAVAAISSIAKEKGLVISPKKMRKAIRQTGTPQYGMDNYKIGNLPDIKSLLKKLKIH
jgi:subtilisin family serine protease